ncbi:MAG: hypothetical protein HZC28_15890 [Spirochaetes bacterium]|nr:hypothetical protein [Spirochaetota bacterium]
MMKHIFAACFLWVLMPLMAADAPNVSPEGLKLFTAHTNFIAFAQSRESEIRSGVNDNMQRVFWIRLSEAVAADDAKNGTKIAIPAEMGRFVPLMPATVRQLKVQLDASGSVEVSLVAADKTHKVNPWWNADNRTTHYFNLGVVADVLKKRDIPASTEDLYLVIKADAALKGVWSGGVSGVPVECDLTRYSSLGTDKPVLRGKLTIDATALRYINGVCGIGATNFFRLYALPDVPMNDGESLTNVSEGVYAQREYTKYGFLPGRQQIQFSYFEKSAKVIAEDTQKPGYTDRGFVVKEKAKADPEKRSRFMSAWSNLDWIECFDNWPSWMTLKKPAGIKNLRGTPDEQYWDAAAELASDMLAVRREQTGRLAGWYEVKNESDLSDEWAYHMKESGADGWEYLARFHGAVASRLHADFPGVKVGGPTTAWLDFSANDMIVAKNQLRFMDMTRDSLDFYAHHYYGVNPEFTSVSKSHFLYGNIDAVTDLLRAHMVNTSNVKPIIVSECGGANADNSRGVETFSHIYRNHLALFHFMERPDIFPMTVFFTIPATWWAKDDKTPLMVYRDPKAGKSGGMVRSTLFDFIEFWSVFADGGRRVPVRIEADEPEHYIKAQAIIRGKTLVAAVFNPKPRKASLSLAAVLPKGAAVISAKQKRLFIDLGVWRVEETDIAGDTVPLYGCETALIVLELSAVPAPAAAQHENTYYADREMLATGGECSLQVSVPVKGLSRSRLRVSLRMGASWKDAVLAVSVNGTALTTRYPLAAMNGIYTSFEFDVPSTLVQEKNTVYIDALPSGGTVAAVTMMNVYR